MKKGKATLVTVVTLVLMAAAIFSVWRGSNTAWKVIEFLYAAYGFIQFGVNFRGWMMNADD